MSGVPATLLDMRITLRERCQLDANDPLASDAALNTLLNEGLCRFSIANPHVWPWEDVELTVSPLTAGTETRKFFVSPTAAQLSTDSFNRANGGTVATALGATDGAGTLDPLTWTKGFAPGVTDLVGMSISGNRVVDGGTDVVTPFGYHTAWVNLGSPDVDVQVNPTTSAVSSHTGGVLFRFSDDSNFWAAVWSFDHKIRVYRYVAGVETLMYLSPDQFFLGGIVRVVLLGSSIAVYNNTTLLTTLTDTFNINATKHGIVLRNNPTGTLNSTALDNWSASLTGFDPLTAFTQIRYVLLYDASAQAAWRFPLERVSRQEQLNRWPQDSVQAMPRTYSLTGAVAAGVGPTMAMRFRPIPDAAYPIRVGGRRILSRLSANSDPSAATNDYQISDWAELLIEYAASLVFRARGDLAESIAAMKAFDDGVLSMRRNVRRVVGPGLGQRPIADDVQLA